MRKMNRMIPIALACAIFAAQPAQAALIIRADGTTTDTKKAQTTQTTGTQDGSEGGPGYETSDSSAGTNQKQVSDAAKAAADAIAKPEISSEAGILYDVTIGDNVIIGAGSLVNKSIPSGTVAAGVPCKVIGSFEEFQQRMVKDEFK